MMNRMMTSGEAATVRINLREIEERLGYPVPGGIVDYNMLKSRMLSPGDISVIVNNIKEVDKRRYYDRPRYRSSGPATPLENIIGLVIFGIGLIMYIFNL